MASRQAGWRPILLAAAGWISSLLLAACSAVVLPYDAAVANRSQRRIVVLVPGITGVELIDPETGKTVWGRGANLIAPRDHGYRLAMSVHPPESAESVGSELVPGRALERIRLGPVAKPVYGPIVQLLEQHGWQLGDLSAPRTGDDLFLFAYDWRRDNSLSARRLAEQLETLAAQRGTGDQSVALVCQSNGAHICRYLTKYGKATLAEAELGSSQPPAGVRIEQLVLVGNANGGSLRILRYLNRGRKYVWGIGRKFSPETFFTFESLYQDLPAYRPDLFVDASGQPLDIDLYDTASWKQYGWSIYQRETARRVARTRRTDLFADAAGRDAHLARQLANARRFQALLMRDVSLGPTRYYLIQNKGAPTPDRAVLKSTGGGWETLITGDRRLDKLAVSAAVAAEGDGHATDRSQLWLAPTEIEAFGDEPYYVDGPHFEMILETVTLERLLTILAGDQSGLRAR